MNGFVEQEDRIYLSKVISIQCNHGTICFKQCFYYNIVIQHIVIAHHQPIWNYYNDHVAKLRATLKTYFVLRGLSGTLNCVYVRSKTKITVEIYRYLNIGSIVRRILSTLINHLSCHLSLSSIYTKIIFYQYNAFDWKSSPMNRLTQSRHNYQNFSVFH